MAHEISLFASIDGIAPRDERVLAILAPAADDVVALLDEGDHRGMSRGSFCRSPSDVTTSRPRAWREAGGKRRRLAEIAAEADHAQPRIARLQRGQLLERVVGAAIVDDQQFVAAPVLTQRLGQLVIERLDVGDSLWTGMTIESSGVIKCGNQGII